MALCAMATDYRATLYAAVASGRGRGRIKCEDFEHVELLMYIANLLSFKE